MNTSIARQRTRTRRFNLPYCRNSVLLIGLGCAAGPYAAALVYLALAGMQ